MNDGPIVALEIGTSKVCVVVGEPHEGGNIMITGLGECPSCGVRKGEVIDLENAATCVRKALQDAEESAQVEIRDVVLGVTGAQIRSVLNSGTVQVADPGRGVTVEDIEEVRNVACAVNLPHDSDLVHSIFQKFSVDDQRGVVNPEGMHGARLSLEMLIIYGSRAKILNTAKAAQTAGVDVNEVAFSGLCSALAALTREQKQCGVALIDLGGGTTSYVAYADETLAMSGAFAVGGDHVTNDIALGLNVSQRRAELLKHEHGSAIVNPGTHFQQVTISSEVGFNACTVGLSELNKIVNARAAETLTLVRNELARKGLLASLGGGVVLTGGGARLKKLDALAEEIFEMPASIGRPRQFSGLALVYESPQYAALLGLIRFAAMSSGRDTDRRSLGGILKKIFGGR